MPKTDAPRDGPAVIAMVRIQARPLEDDGSGQTVFLKPEQVAYFFSGSAVENGLITTVWVPARPTLIPGEIYVRTIKGEVYRAVQRSLAEIGRQFGEPLFLIHQSLLINLNMLHSACLRPPDRLVGMRVNTGVRGAKEIDYLTVARSRVADLTQRLTGEEFDEEPDPA